jgi:hypothetical protein
MGFLFIHLFEMHTHPRKEIVPAAAPCVSAAYLRWRDRDSIAMAGRLGDHEKARLFAATIEDLMRRQRGHGEASEWRETEFFAIEFDGEHAGEHVEELRRALMHVALLRGIGRHTFFDHAEGIRAMEMPAIAQVGTDGAGPGVVLGVAGAGDFHCGGLLPSEQRGETIGYAKLRMRRLQPVFFLRNTRNVANPDDFTIFVVVRRHGFRPSLPMLTNFL